MTSLPKYWESWKLSTDIDRREKCQFKLWNEPLKVVFEIFLWKWLNDEWRMIRYYLYAQSGNKFHSIYFGITPPWSIDAHLQTSKQTAAVVTLLSCSLSHRPTFITISMCFGNVKCEIKM